MNYETMNNNNTILYVDDEEKALKYFQKAVGKDHDVVIATSVDEGWKIVEERAGDLAILISDQRMPGKSGVELLSRVRENYPKIVRILTTAFSDLDSAIDAVNDGAIYQYIVKPWDLRDLRANLRRAMDFYLLQRERDMLMRQKLSVLQRMIITDRVQSLSIFAIAIEQHLENSPAALGSFLDFLPERIQEGWSRSAVTQSQHHWEDLGALAKGESRLTLAMIKKMGDVSGAPAPNSLEKTQVEALLQEVIDSVSGQFPQHRDNFQCRWKPDLPSAMLHRELFRGAFHKLMEGLILLYEPEARFYLKMDVRDASSGAPALMLDLLVEGEAPGNDAVRRLFSVLNDEEAADASLNLLRTFFVVYHHRGTLRLDLENPKAVRFEICLPLDREAAPRPAQGEPCLEKLLAHFDRWDAAFL